MLRCRLTEKAAWPPYDVPFRHDSVTSIWLVVAAVAFCLTPDRPSPEGTVYPIDSLVTKLKQSDRAYLQFVTVPILRAGLYTLSKGGTDRQQPHDRDELYYVLEGRSSMTIGEDEHDVNPGDVIYVAANAEHRFHDIKEDLMLLVFFSEADPDVSD